MPSPYWTTYEGVGRYGSIFCSVITEFFRTLLVDALLSELSGSPSRYDERLAAASHLLSRDNRVCGFVAFALQQPVGVIILSENASIYAGGMFGVITELYVVPAQRSAGVATKLVNAAVTWDGNAPGDGSKLPASLKFEPQRSISAVVAVPVTTRC